MHITNLYAFSMQLGSIRCCEPPCRVHGQRHWSSSFLKGKPNSQGILNWIIQILLQEATQIYRKLTIYCTKCCYFSALLSIYCGLCFLSLPEWQSFFSSWTQYSAKLNAVFDLTGHDLWFTTRFWIFTTEFFAIMSIFTTR